MSLTAKETAQLRKELTERYHVDLQGKITRVEFLTADGKIIVYFHAYDSFEKPKPTPAEPKEYILLAYKNSLEDEPFVAVWDNLTVAEKVFNMYAKAEYKHLILLENGQKAKEYIAQ